MRACLSSSWLRLALTAALLAEVWRHAHWSVALSLTLFAAYVEADSWATRRVSEDVGKLSGRRVRGWREP